MIVLVILFNLLLITFDITGASLAINSTINDGSSCTIDKECMEHATCMNSLCVCDVGYIQSTDLTECLPYVTEYKGSCKENSQCEWLGDNSICEYKLCKCQEGYRWFQGSCKKYVGYGETCQIPSDCYDGYNLQALTCNSDHICTCNSNFYLRDGTNDCRLIASEVGAPCALNSDCQLDNAVCHIGTCQITDNQIQDPPQIARQDNSESNKHVPKPCNSTDDCDDNFECFELTETCICKKGYFFYDGQCIPELGTDLGPDCSASNCSINGSVCLNGACYCRPYWFNNDGNTQCIKTMSQENTNCLSNEWCYVLGKYSYCNTEETCTCSGVADFNETTTYCEKISDEPVECRWDYECSDGIIQNTFCMDEICRCKDNYREDTDYNACLPNLGAHCTEEYNCTMENSMCNDEGICECLTDYIASNNTACFPLANLDEDCVFEEQCQRMQHAECINGKCLCPEIFTPYLNTCYFKKNFGDYCENNMECTVSLGEGFECRRGICQCPTYYTYENGKCSSLSWSNVSNWMLVALFVIVIQLVN